MIKKILKQDIFTSKAKHIAFAINVEGINDAGFAGAVSSKFWPELAYIGESQKLELGQVLSKETEDCTFHALVCHSLNDGWKNQTAIIKECFDEINCGDATIATIAIGTGLVGVLSGARFSEIKQGMEESKQDIELYM